MSADMVGARFRAWRGTRRQEDIAQQAKLSKNAISKIEQLEIRALRERRSDGIETIIKVANAYRIKTGDFVDYLEARIELDELTRRTALHRRRAWVTPALVVMSLPIIVLAVVAGIAMSWRKTGAEADHAPNLLGVTADGHKVQRAEDVSGETLVLKPVVLEKLPASLYDLYATSPLQAWALGADGTIIATDDGFKTWKTLPTGGADYLIAGFF